MGAYSWIEAGLGDHVTGKPTPDSYLRFQATGADLVARLQNRCTSLAMAAQYTPSLPVPWSLRHCGQKYFRG